MKACIVTLIALFTLLHLSGCKNKGSVDSNGMPKVLLIAAVQTESMDDLKKARGQICNFLSKKLGIPVEMVYSTDYSGVIEALKSNKVHMANMPPFAYVIATREMTLIPIVTLGNNGKPSTYQSVIISNGHGNIKSMADVKARSKSLTFCFVDPASTSGHLIPRAYLNSIGLNPDTAFKNAFCSFFTKSLLRSLRATITSFTIGGDVHKITKSSFFTSPSLIILARERSIFVHPISTLPDLTLRMDAAWVPAKMVDLKALSGLRPMELR